MRQFLLIVSFLALLLPGCDKDWWIPPSPLKNSKGPSKEWIACEKCYDDRSDCYKNTPKADQKKCALAYDRCFQVNDCFGVKY